jgi:hypothetical protein
MTHAAPNPRKQTPYKPSRLFIGLSAFLLMSMGAVVAVGTRALIGEKPAKAAALADEPSSEDETDSSAPAPQARAPENERRGPPARPEPRMPSGPDLRASVREASEARTAGVRDAAGLTALLADLENAARAKGHVTAFEVEPGLAAIRTVYANDDAESQRLSSEFAARMTKLSASFDPPPAPPASPQGPTDQRPIKGRTP